MNISPNKNFLILGAGFALLAVFIGAFGAHSLSQFVDAGTLQGYETGVRYQFYHVFALFILGILGDHLPNSLASWAGRLFVAGIILFSGSLYFITGLKAVGAVIPLAVGLLTPLGGLLFIAGWVVFLIAILKTSHPQVA